MKKKNGALGFDIQFTPHFIDLRVHLCNGLDKD